MVTGCWEFFDRDGGQKRVAKAKKGVVRLLWPLSAATITAINVKWKLDSGNRNDLGNQIGAADTALSFRFVLHGQTTKNTCIRCFQLAWVIVKVLVDESEKERVENCHWQCKIGSKDDLNVLLHQLVHLHLVQPHFHLKDDSGVDSHWHDPFVCKEQLLLSLEGEESAWFRWKTNVGN